MEFSEIFVKNCTSVQRRTWTTSLILTNRLRPAEMSHRITETMQQKSLNNFGRQWYRVNGDAFNWMPV